VTGMNTSNAPQLRELLNDPNRVTVSASEAAAILGIARSTAHNLYTRTGQLCDGVPVLRFGRRAVVSTCHLRAVLGLPEPTTAP
jgi:hypothetical protein